MRKDASPLRNVRQPLTQESGWIRGIQKTSVFQENTKWISADSILKGNSSLNIESKIGFANELVDSELNYWEEMQSNAPNDPPLSIFRINTYEAARRC